MLNNILVKIPKQLKDKLSKTKIKNIIEKSFDLKKYEYKVELEERKQGAYIILENENSIKFILISREKEDGRNSYLVQRVPPIYNGYINYKGEKNKFLECYLLNENEKILTNYQLFIVKLLLTLNFKILNINDVKFDGKIISIIDKFIINSKMISKFNDFKEIRNFRYFLSKKSNNLSTTFEMIDNKINVYGKTFGANGMETIIISLSLRALLNDIEIYIYAMDEKTKNHETKFNEKQKDILKYYKINLIEENIPLLKKDNLEIAKRNQREFRINLLNKYKEKNVFYVIAK